MSPTPATQLECFLTLHRGPADQSASARPSRSLGDSLSQPWGAPRLGSFFQGDPKSVSVQIDFLLCWQFHSLSSLKLVESTPLSSYSKGALVSLHRPPLPRGAVSLTQFGFLPTLLIACGAESLRLIDTLLNVFSCTRFGPGTRSFVRTVLLLSRPCLALVQVGFSMRVFDGRATLWTEWTGCQPKHCC